MDNETIDLAQVEADAMPEPEKMIPASKVTEMIRSERFKALEKGRREAAFLTQQQQQSSAPPAEQASSNGANMSPDDVRGLFAEETRRMQEHLYQQQQELAQQQKMQQIVKEFESKLETGKEKYADFDEIVNKKALPSIAYMAQLANEVDNTADVMYEVMKNPSKITSILGLVDPKLPHEEQFLAHRAMKNLSESIKSNEKALGQRAPSQPLSHLKPSNVSSDNGSPSSVSDFRRMSWLRG